jgi:hypothetical protein
MREAISGHHRRSSEVIIKGHRRPSSVALTGPQKHSPSEGGEEREAEGRLRSDGLGEGGEGTKGGPLLDEEHLRVR